MPTIPPIPTSSATGSAGAPSAASSTASSTPSATHFAAAIWFDFAAAIWFAAGGSAADLASLRYAGAGELASAFAVSDLAAGSIGAAGLALAEFAAATRTTQTRPAASATQATGVAAPGNGKTGPLPAVLVDRRLASWWFASSFEPLGWQVPPASDDIAGDYATVDGWIRLHTNAPHHRAAALAVLEVPGERAAVAAAVARWPALALETAVVAHGGCAAQMRSSTAWQAHPQGQAVCDELLLHVVPGSEGPPLANCGEAGRPLSGIRVLDLTRVLAGPAASRFLAGFGAEVLRIDPPWWNEPGNEPDMTLGKRCARLDLRLAADRQRFEALLAEADVLIHGYRSDALASLGLDAAARQAIRPGLVDVSLDAYGFSGPWHARRGFDSLVQMSSGIAHAGMRWAGSDRPTPLPVQALDHATGYIVATAALRGLVRRVQLGIGSISRTSLARTAALLISAGATPRRSPDTPLVPPGDADFSPEPTPWGAGRRLQPPLVIDGVPMHWSRGASSLGSAPARW